MNERIRELMLRAGYAHPEAAKRAHKLAELVIEECVSAVLMTSDRYRKEYFADCINEHFEVNDEQTTTNNWMR